MFNIGFFEMVFIAILALIVIGPKQLPHVARSIGKFLNELKRATGDITGAYFDSQRTINTFVNKTKEELTKRTGLEKAAQSLNQSTDQFVEKLKKEIEEIEAKKPSEGDTHE